MKKTVLTYGLISGAIAAVLLFAQVPSMNGSSGALIVGCTGIVLSALLIFLGVRSYREWELVYYGSPGIADHVFDEQIEDLKAKAAPQAEIDAAVVQVASFKKLYANPLVNAAFTFIEPFPVGVLMTLISAVISSPEMIPFREARSGRRAGARRGPLRSLTPGGAPD